MKLANLLKRARIKKGISQNQLGRYLEYTNGQFISNYECGRCPLPLKQIIKAGIYLGLTSNNMLDAYLADSKKLFQDAP